MPQGNLFVKAVNETYGFLVFKIGNKDIELKEAEVDMSTYNTDIDDGEKYKLASLPLGEVYITGKK